MLDTSGSMTLNMQFVKHAAEQFLIRLLPQDKAKVGAFNDKIQVLPKDEHFTNNRDRLIRLLKDDLDFGYPTRLWDAVDESIAHPRAGSRAGASSSCSPTATTAPASAGATTCSSARARRT